jgi:hypothetical protein
MLLWSLFAFFPGILYDKIYDSSITILSKEPQKYYVMTADRIVMPRSYKSRFRFDVLVKSPLIVMPDTGSKPALDLIQGPAQALISLPRHVVSRGHPETAWIPAATRMM